MTRLARLALDVETARKALRIARCTRDLPPGAIRKAERRLIMAVALAQEAAARAEAAVRGIARPA